MHRSVRVFTVLLVLAYLTAPLLIGHGFAPAGFYIVFGPLLIFAEVSMLSVACVVGFFAVLAAIASLFLRGGNQLFGGAASVVLIESSWLLLAYAAGPESGGDLGSQAMCAALLHVVALMAILNLVVAVLRQRASRN